jgi:acetyl-CoA carboxylase biotin carboxyl carrier protein
VPIAWPERYGPPGGPPIDRRSEIRAKPFSRRSTRGVPAKVPSPDPVEEEARVAAVEAHITGTVWKIECQVGDAIAEGDTVVVLESMKMEMPVEAEDAGTVAEIRCEEGQAVNEGDTLVVLDQG